MSDAARLYASRKRGHGMGARYFLTSLMPLLILFAVTAALVFALSFIASFSAEIDRMIAVMGSGTIHTLSDPSSLLPPDAEVSMVRTGSALAYSENGEGALVLKGVEDDYFSGMRGNELDIRYWDGECNNPVVISSSLSRRLGLAAGDRFTLLVWEEDKGRARPYLVTVSAVFSSVYPQLDSHLAFVPLQMLSSLPGYEILLPEGEEPDALLQRLWDGGVAAESYRTMYSALYSNVRSSIGILYVILIAVALLAAFFSSDAAQVYIERDRNDIIELSLLGMERKMIRGIYFRMTLSSVAFSALSGTLLGLAAAALSPLILRSVSAADPALLEYYVTSFSVRFPLPEILLMLLLMLGVSSLSVAFSLRRQRGFSLSG